MPFASRITHVDGLPLLDGGIADSIPVQFSMELGAAKQIVVLTQARSYVKTANRLTWLARLLYRRYPHFVQTLAERHVNYNASTRMVGELEAAGKAFVFRPSGVNAVKHMEKDLQKLYALYREGYMQAEQRLPELLRYLEL